MSEFSDQYSRYQALTETALAAALPLPASPWPDAGIPYRLSEAMRYSLLDGGKRLRPVLLLAAFNILEDDLNPALPFACALEMIHTYSLIHDDLPAIDDDALRRGKPTSHKVFGEAMAILAGDALLNLAFETMSLSSHVGALDALRIIAYRAGAGGMIAGQAADMILSGHKPEKSSLRYIHLHKTADLITAGILAGLSLASADSALIKAGLEFGTQFGLAFQITDDLLDIRGDAALTGKAVSKDLAHGKMTWPNAVGIEQAEADAQQAILSAIGAAEGFGRQSAFFQALAGSVQKRVK